MRNCRWKFHSPSGFTLIEVMIAVAIMGALSLLTYQAVRSTVQNRAKIQSLISNETKLGDSLRAIEHDVSRAFHYRNIHFEVLKESRKDLAGSQPGVQPGVQPGSQVITPNDESLAPPPNYTGFVGRSNSLFLTTLSNYRTRQNSPESDQLTVGYTLKNCPPREGQEDMPGQCLFRSRKTFLEEDLERNGVEDLVVENVSSLSFRYFGEGVDEWMDRWVSTENGETFSIGKFPQAVEVSLSLYTSNQAAQGQTEIPTLQRTIIVPLRFPNNPKGPQPAPTGVVGDGFSN